VKSPSDSEEQQAGSVEQESLLNWQINNVCFPSFPEKAITDFVNYWKSLRGVVWQLVTRGEDFC
jgi:hypothetical protein